MLIQEFADHPFVVLGANKDDNYEDIKDWLEENKIGWRCFSGFKEDWFHFHVTHSYVIDEQGKILFHGNPIAAAKFLETLMADAGYDVKLTPPGENK